MEDVWCLEVHKDPSNHSEEGLCFVLAFPYKLLNLVPALEDNPTQFNMNIRLGCSLDCTLLTQLLTTLSQHFLSCCCLEEIHVYQFRQIHVTFILLTNLSLLFLSCCCLRAVGVLSVWGPLTYWGLSKTNSFKYNKNAFFFKE